jgi:hypothetical protein
MARPGSRGSCSNGETQVSPSHRDFSRVQARYAVFQAQLSVSPAGTRRPQFPRLPMPTVRRDRAVDARGWGENNPSGGGGDKMDKWGNIHQQTRSLPAGLTRGSLVAGARFSAQPERPAGQARGKAVGGRDWGSTRECAAGIECPPSWFEAREGLAPHHEGSLDTAQCRGGHGTSHRELRKTTNELPVALMVRCEPLRASNHEGVA